MSDTRDDIARAIDQIRHDHSLIDPLKPYTVEGVAAELIAQQRQLVDIHRRTLGDLDFVGRY